MVGRERLWNSRSKLHFILVTTDLSDPSVREIVKNFSDYPVVQRYSSEEVERHFKLRGTKVVGFSKSTLAKEIYAGLKAHRLNMPPKRSAAQETAEGNGAVSGTPPTEDPAASTPVQSK